MSIEINTNSWGDPLTLYAANNVRTGAANLNDPDFTDYPPFVRNDYGYTGEYYQYVIEGDLYYSELAENEYTKLNTPIDRSIAYCACKNLDIPINQIVGFSTGIDSTSSESPDVSDISSSWLMSDETPIPIMFMGGLGISGAIGQGVGSITAFYNPAYRTANGVEFTQYLWSQFASNATNTGQEGSPSTSTGRGRSNKNYFCQYWRDMGIRSVILYIMVKCFHGYSTTTGTPTNIETMSLNTYANKTAEWRAEHPLVEAFAYVRRRNNINGTYGAEADITPDVTINLKARYTYGSIQAGEMVCQPVSNFTTSGDTTVHSLPLFGTQIPHSRSTIQMGTNSNGGASQYVALLIGGSNSNITVKQGTGFYDRSVWCELEGTDDNIELIRSWCAAYGLFFTDGEPTETGYTQLFREGNDTTRWTDNKMCLGVVDNDGFTDGAYTRGTANETANNFEWKTISQSRYNPVVPPPTDDPTIYSDTTDFNLLGGVASCNKMYAVQASSIMNLARALSTAISLRGADVPPLDYSLETFLTNNPLDCIISLRYYPTTAITSGTEEPISFGSYTNASVTGIPFVGSFKKLDFHFSVSARNALYPHFGDFRDYEPYTHAELIVPFCGTVPINPCDFIGHDINVHMIVDYITGSCTAYIAADGLVVTSIAGQIGIEVPLSGIQQATLDGQRVNAVLNRQSAELNATNAAVGGLTSAIGFAGSLAGDNIIGAIGAGAGVIGSVNRFQQADISYQKADYDLKHMQVPYKTVSAGSPVASTVIESCCRLIIYRPVMDDRYNADVYARTVGFACLMNGAVNEFTGLTVGNINTDGLNVTETEKQMIQKAFANGVIL